MPSLEWLKTKFADGFDSGDVSTSDPGEHRRKQERANGGSYLRVFEEAVVPFLKPDSVVLELGPGKGSWSRGILGRIPDGTLHTADYLDTSEWITQRPGDGSVICHQVNDNSFSDFADQQFDFFFSFGVLCHNSVQDIEDILTNVLPKMKPGAVSVHQYADWKKLDHFGWNEGNVPVRFKELPDKDIWWPRNDATTMAAIARKAGWTVVHSDLRIVKRDGIIQLKKEG